MQHIHYPVDIFMQPWYSMGDLYILIRDKVKYVIPIVILRGFQSYDDLLASVDKKTQSVPRARM